MLAYTLVASLLPETVAAPKKSALEGRDYAQFPEMTVKTIAKGSFQSGFESYVADHVPLRNELLLANARVQRDTIRVANLAFGFDAYPTFFGSGYLYCRDYDALVDKPIKRSKNSVEHLEKVASRYSALVERHPDIRWVYYLADRSSTSLASPAHGLVSDAADYAYFREHFLDNLTDKCTVVDGGYVDPDEFFEDHFSTDHHWQIQGAVKAYERISAVFGNTPLDVKGYERVFAGPFWGSYARSGLYADGDGSYVDDVVYNRSPLKVVVGGKEESESFLDEGFAADGGASFTLSDPFASAYAQWFHHPEKTIVITNDDVEDGALLIMGDSYTDNLERLFAENYHVVYKVEPRNFKGDIDKFIEKNDIDDALFMFNETLYDSKATMNALK